MPKARVVQFTRNISAAVFEEGYDARLYPRLSAVLQDMAAGNLA